MIKLPWVPPESSSGIAFVQQFIAVGEISGCQPQRAFKLRFSLVNACRTLGSYTLARTCKKSVSERITLHTMVMAVLAEI
jgi:hypothetical protein